jgi:ferrochelatase
MNGVLLVNLGTPDSPTPKAVGKYLLEFLSDPRVVDLPRWLWLPLLRLVIVPLRRHRSAAAYRKVWRPEGSPLLVLSRRLAGRLGELLLGKAEVVLAMRYGCPCMTDALRKLRERGVKRVIVVPMYPQFSLTTTETVFDAVGQGLRALEWYPKVETIRDYHDDPRWLDAVASSVRDFQERAGQPDKLIFSLHGIPQRYVRQGDPYENQCKRSVSAIAKRLGLDDERWMLTFQSRVGKEPWLQPYTDKTLEALPQQGVRHVQVVCPGFAVDCLETLEEIAVENRDRFIDSGGEKLEYIPALNESQEHVEILAGLVRDQLAGETDGSGGQSPR